LGVRATAHQSIFARARRSCHALGVAAVIQQDKRGTQGLIISAAGLTPLSAI
jgi:hypothetical protein